jgi:hypothetical protein
MIGGEIIAIDGTKSRGHIVKVKFVGKLTHDQK